MTITLEDSDGRVLATITPGEGSKIFLRGSRDQVRIEALENEDGFLKARIWAPSPDERLGRVCP